MHTEHRAAKILCLLIAFLSFYSAAGQDSVNIKPFERYWTKPRLVHKAGVGIQQTAFIEAGVQLHKIYIHPLSLASAGPYVTVEGMVKDDRVIVGPKAGYEITAGLVGIAADFTWYSDFSGHAWVFTPKAGLSIMGFVNLFYGRNFGLSEFQFDYIDKSRFSLVFNLNRDYFDLRNAPKNTKKGRK